jgi:hypothetical protein
VRRSIGRRRDDMGQAKFWQIAIILVIVVVLGFDIASPQIVKVQLSDRAKNAGLDASQSAVRAGAASYADKYNAVCDIVTRRLESYGAKLIPPQPGSDCPDLDLDGTVTFSAEKPAPSLILKYIGLRGYYTVRVDVSVRFSGGI